MLGFKVYVYICISLYVQHTSQMKSVAWNSSFTKCFHIMFIMDVITKILTDQRRD